MACIYQKKGIKNWEERNRKSDRTMTSVEIYANKNEIETFIKNTTIYDEWGNEVKY